MHDSKVDLRSVHCGWTGFFFACHEGHSDVVKTILEYSSKVAIDFNDRSGFGDITPFMAACEQGHSQTVKLLLENSRNLNIDVNAMTNDGVNGLILACLCGHKNIIKLLLEFASNLDTCIDFNARNRGLTAFGFACLLGKVEVVKIFLEYSNIVDVSGVENLQLSKTVKHLIDQHHPKKC